MDLEVKDLLNSLLQAIECERDEERQRHINEIKSLSPYLREMKGRALINLKKRKVEMTLTGDYLYTFYKKDKSDLPELEISTGDQVVISQYDPLDSMNPTGIVYEVGNNYIKIQTGILIKGVNRPYRVDLFVNDLTYQRMEQAISLAKSSSNSFIQEILSGKYYANTKSYENEKFIDGLNQKQREGLEYSLSCNGFYSVQGPPGTGKSFMSARIVKSLVDNGRKVLISADSNAAVDNLLKKCLELGLDVVRLGHPIRVNSDLKPYTLDYRVVYDALFQDIYTYEKEIEKTKLRLKELEKPSQKNLRGLSYQEVMDLIEKNQSARGLSKRALRSMKPYVKTYLKIEKLYEKIKEVKEEISLRIMTNARVIASTNSTCACEIMQTMHFDFALVDEASQSSIPSTLIPVLKADRFILVGDHFQLPPVVISREASDKGLNQSLMNYLAYKYPFQICMLEVQYRMNRDISNLVSDVFYSSKLIADNSVINTSLKLKNKNNANSKSLEFVNVEGREFIKIDSKSFYNLKEIEVCEKIVKLYLEAGIKPEDIAIISPYRAQVELLRRKIDMVEIDTVDAFQGREKDLVIISSVRANDEENLGFLSDKRRLNVSISRAKKKMILIGSKKLLLTNYLYKAVISRILKS